MFIHMSLSDKDLEIIAFLINKVRESEIEFANFEGNTTLTAFDPKYREFDFDDSYHTMENLHDFLHECLAEEYAYFNKGKQE